MISDISQENYQIDFSEMMKELSAVPTPTVSSECAGLGDDKLFLDAKAALVV